MNKLNVQIVEIDNGFCVQHQAMQKQMQRNKTGIMEEVMAPVPVVVYAATYLDVCTYLKSIWPITISE